jgi:hypothetical protein
VQSLFELKAAAYYDGTVDLEPNPGLEPAHAAHGVTCAACHVRQGRIHGPPRSQKSPVIDRTHPEVGTHPAAVRLRFFETAEFCAECHQFTGAKLAGDKPIQNTYVEWQQSDYGKNEVACVFCHMPDRRHLFRGIHHPDMVGGALMAETDTWVENDEVVAEMTLMNQGAGHAMPTYVTPRLEAHLELLDAAGSVVQSAVYVIARVAEPGRPHWKELSDTRLMPLRPVTFSVRAPRQGVVAYRQRVDVDPDHYYRGFYERLLDRADLPAASRRLIEEAHAATLESRYVLHQRTEAVRP